MPDLIFQRVDRIAYWEKYPIYINRKMAARIPFGEEVTLKLAPGRYHISIGGLRAMDDQLWLDLADRRKVIQVDAEWRPFAQRKWPKNYQLQLKEIMPIRMAKPVEQEQLRFLYRQSLARVLAFVAVLLLAAAFLFYLAESEEDPLFFWLALVPIILSPWVYHGFLLAHLKNKI